MQTCSAKLRPSDDEICAMQIKLLNYQLLSAIHAKSESKGLAFHKAADAELAHRNALKPHIQRMAEILSTYARDS